MASNRTRGNVFQKNRFSKSLLSRFFICFKDGHGVWGGVMSSLHFPEEPNCTTAVSLEMSDEPKIRQPQRFCLDLTNKTVAVV